MEEVKKKTAQKFKTLLIDIEQRQKGPPEPGTQVGVVLEKHDNGASEEAEGEEDEIFLFLCADGNSAP